MDIDAANWAPVDDDNDEAAPNGAPEGMLSSGVNNTMRAMMGATKRFRNHLSPKTTAGSASAFTVSYDVTPGALYPDATHLVEFHAANAASATLDINALGAKPLHVLKPAGWGVVPVSTVVANMVCRVTYHETSGAYRMIEGPMSAVEAGTGGYTVGPSGIRRQWGQVVVGGNSSATVTFPVAFASIHTIQTMPNGASGAVSIYPWISAASTSNFTLQNGSANGINFLWSAEGVA